MPKECPEEIPVTKVPMEDLEQHIEEAYVIEAEGFKTEFEVCLGSFHL